VRYDGASMARRDVASRELPLGILAFSPIPLVGRITHHSCGNYDTWIAATLRWYKGISLPLEESAKVHRGQSGRLHVRHVQMASPLSKGLFCGRIGESGSIWGNRATYVEYGEQMGPGLRQ